MALLQVANVSIKFGGLTAVSDVSLAVEPHSIHGLIGPNGAGKSTLFNLVTGIYKPSAGRVTFEGQPISGLPVHEITRRGIARTFQALELFKGMTVREHVLLGAHRHVRGALPMRMLKALLGLHWSEETALEQRAGQFLQLVKLEHLAEELVTNLPFGLQRRVELARALSSYPSLLLLDEPMSGLNTQEKAELTRELRRLTSQFNLTVLIVEHDMNVIMDLCDRVTVMNHGKKIAEGTPDQVRNDPLVIEAYLGTASVAAS